MAIRGLQQYFRNENCKAKIQRPPEVAIGEVNKNMGMRRILCCSRMGFIQNR